MLANILYSEIYLICIVVLAMLLFWSVRSESRSASERWLIRVLACFLISFSSNFLFSALIHLQTSLPFIRHVNFALKSIYYIMLATGVVNWCGYAETEIRKRSVGKGKVHLLMILPTILPIGLIASNFWTHAMFTIGEDGTYIRGTHFNYLMLYLIVLTLAQGIRLLIRSSREFDPKQKNHMRLAASFPLAMIAAWALARKVGEAYPVMCVVIMLELLCLFVGTSQQQISMDKLTQINNRQNLIGFINYKLINHEDRMFVLMIDVDYFKEINDTYGHLEGDSALMRVSNSLKEACLNYKKRPFIARYGGDEFIIVLEGTQEEAAALRDSIKEILRQKQEAEASYPMTLSIGIAGYRSGMNSKDLIAAADEELYKIKQTRPAFQHI